eukprot:scaffold370405_cov40-Prasinocladus_malaysianus.AAC.1
MSKIRLLSGGGRGAVDVLAAQPGQVQAEEADDGRPREGYAGQARGLQVQVRNAGILRGGELCLPCVQPVCCLAAFTWLLTA